MQQCNNSTINTNMNIMTYREQLCKNNINISVLLLLLLPMLLLPTK